MKVTTREVKEISETTPFVELLIEALHDSEEIEFEVVEQLEEENDVAEKTGV